jgi:hypothetical protein
MRSFLLSCLCAASVTLPLITWPAPAAADPTKVRILPGDAPDVADGRFDRLLPASKEFMVEMRLADLHIDPKREASGTLFIWPSAEHPCGESVPPEGVKQRYELGMILGGTDSDRVLTAAVPALQIGQEFCFKTMVTPTIDKDTLALVARSTAQHIVGQLAARPDAGANACAGVDIPAAFTAALRDQARLDCAIPEGHPGGPKRGADCAGAARHASDVYALGGVSTCVEAAVKARQRSEAQRVLHLLDTARGSMVDRLRTLAPLERLDQPIVVLDNGTVALAAELIQPPTSKPEALQTLKRAAEQLEARRGGAEPWAMALRNLREALKSAGDDAAVKKAVESARADAGKLRKKSSFPLEIWDKKQSKLLPLAEYLAHPDTVRAAEVLAQIKDMAGAFPPPGRQPNVDALAGVLRDVQDLDARLDAAENALSQATTELNDARTKLEKALESAFNDDRVRQQIQVVLGSVNVRARTGRGISTTDANKNYASPDFGVMVGLPSGGLAHDVWFLPYAGLNIYFTPVDRAITPGELTGTTAQKVAQRLSVMVGTTLWAPPLSGRTVNRPIGIGNFPVLGLGCRLSQFMHLTGALVFYDLTDKNPASAGHKLYVAPSLGGGVDADIVQLLTNVLNK